MSETISGAPIAFRVLNFAAPAAAEALSRDMAELGFAHRVEAGADWLRRGPAPAARRRPAADVVLLGGAGPGRPPAAYLERLAARPWICVLDRRASEDWAALARASTDFLRAPWSREELAIRLERIAARLDGGDAEAGAGGDALAEPDDRAGLGIVGAAPAFLRALALARRAAQSEAPVVVEGETGTGKELVARLIHRLGPRARRPFAPVNCGCLPPDLVENELFGHVAGAFTGAGAPCAGLVRQADRGTLFLDEVDALPPRAQVALLRFLQEGEVRPVGGGPLARVDVRVIAAANRPLAALVAEGRFREDLYFRLNVLHLRLPPLRERRADIDALVAHFLLRFGETYGAPGLTLSRDAADWLAGHALPGNVRQLENLVHRAVLNAEGPRIDLADIAPEIAGAIAGAIAGQIAGDAARAHRPPPPACAPPASAPFAEAKARAVDAFERDYLAEVMARAGGNVTAAARLAGKERRALGKLLKKHGVGPDDRR